MHLNYTDCRRRFGSPYQINKAITDGRLTKIESGVYSDDDMVTELGVVYLCSHVDAAKQFLESL